MTLLLALVGLKFYYSLLVQIKMWSNFEASTVEDETISNAFSSRSIFKISCEDAVNIIENKENKGRSEGKQQI